MANTTVYFSDLFNGVSREGKNEYEKVLEEQILHFTNLKNTVSEATAVLGRPKISIVMHDFGNLTGLLISAMIFAIKLKTIVFFAKKSIVLSLKDIDVTLAGVVVG